MPENEELDDQSLFDAAVSDEPEAISEQPSQIDMLAEAKAEVEAKEQQARDEAGRFAKAEDPSVDAEKPPIPPKPEWRLKEDAERARQAETELANERAEKAALKQRLEALERPAVKQEPEKVAKPDPLLDPEGYEKYLETKFEERLLNDRREASLATAHRVYKTEFEEAYAAAQKQVDPALRARMQQSRDPGETLMEWHRELKTRAEVGSDLKAYKQKLREEALKDPEFRKAAMEAWRTEASTQTPDGRPRVNLSPSLNGASRSNAMLRSADGDLSDHELFEQTTG